MDKEDKQKITVSDIESAMKELGLNSLYPKAIIFENGGIIYEVSEGVFTGAKGAENFHQRLLDECGIVILKHNKKEKDSSIMNQEDKIKVWSIYYQEKPSDMVYRYMMSLSHKLSYEEILLLRKVVEKEVNKIRNK